MRPTFYAYSNPASSVASNQVLSLLNKIRVREYRIHDINLVTAEQLKGIKTVALQLGCAILRVNISDTTERATAQQAFTVALNTLFKNSDKFQKISFACHLLQYYTIVSNDAFSPTFTSADFHKFLDEHSEHFGNSKTNLFITEYKLIKTYNEIAHCSDTSNGTVAPISKIKEKIEFNLTQLNILSKQINTWATEAPDHVFVQYLLFASSYTIAKAFELQYALEDGSMSDPEKNFIAESQQYCLKIAVSQLEKIKELGGDKQYFTTGIEYSLGRCILNQLPNNNLEEVKTHVRSLIL